MKVATLKESVQEKLGRIGSVQTCGIQERALSALIRMKKHGIHHLPVTLEGHIVGMVSDRDILARALTLGAGDELSWLSVREAMRRDPPAVTPATEVGEALDIMLKEGFSALPIMVNDELVGVVSETDFLRLASRLLKRKTSYVPGTEILANPLAQNLLALLADIGV